MSAAPPVTDRSTLGLYPFYVKGKSDHYIVVGLENRRAISTTKAGVEVIRLLAKGRTVSDTRCALGRRYGRPPDEVDLTPLLGTLFASGFVRTLDGREVATRSKPIRRNLRLWLALFVSTPLLELVLRYLPPRRALPIAYRWFGRSPGANPDLERRIATNLRRTPALGRTAAEIAGIAAANAHVLRKQFCDRLLLTAVPPRRLRRWLGEEVLVTGLEHLARARASGRGTILCSFHIGSYGLIPFVLAARGMAVTVYAGFGSEARADIATWLAERARGDAYPMRVVGGAMGLRALVRCLEQGETVLLYCDREPGEAGSSRQVQGHLGVPFLGTRIWTARGAAWLRSKTGAAMLPVVLLWVGRRGHHLYIEPELACNEQTDRSNEMEAAMAAVYGVLERYVRRDPAQWLKWADFGGMVECGEGFPALHGGRRVQYV